MGFDHANDAPVAPAPSAPPAPAPESNNEQLAVKISHGNEIRRVTLPQSSYPSLVEHTASLFGLPQANIILKYEDDDGDKISMSSDMELREALRLSKASQKILRLFVELKTKTEATPESPSISQNTSSVYLGPQGRFGLPPPPRPHVHPHSPGFTHHMPPPGFSPHPHPPHHPPHQFGAPFFPAASYHVHQQAAAQPNTTTTTSVPPANAAHGMTYAAPLGASSSMGGMDSERGWGRGGSHHGPVHYRRHHNNSYFGPQTSWSTHSNSTGTWSDGCGFDRKAHKESMRVMRDQWKEMKAEMKRGGNVSEEDKRKFREMKEEMKNEMRGAKKDALSNMKAMKLSDKKQRLVARHVADVTIPDGTELPPNTPFIKTWRIRNEGPAWPTGSQLLFVSHKGDNLNGPERVVIKGEVPPGQEVEVSVPLITPNEPGRYVGYYRMVTPDNVKFGQRVWVSFIVTKPSDINDSTPTVNF